MEPVKENIGEIYAARAMANLEPDVKPISIPKAREPRDMVYNGNTINSGKNEVNVKRGNGYKKNSNKRISPFTIIIILLSIAVGSVTYISNILAIDKLMSHVNQLQTKHKQVLNEQELLKAQINRLSSMERIQQIGQEQLELKNPKSIPVWIEINSERVKQVEEMLKEQSENIR